MFTIVRIVLRSSSNPLDKDRSMNVAIVNSNMLMDHRSETPVPIVVRGNAIRDTTANETALVPFSLRVGGPIWLGPLFDQSFVTELISSIEQAPADR